MPRKKSYEASNARVAPAAAAITPPEPPAPEPPAPNADDAYIDMVELLGTDARFPHGTKTLDLREWLRRGIDPWVFASGFCLKTLLLSGRSTASVTNYYNNLPYLFEYLSGGEQTSAASRPPSPSSLSPLHVQHFVGWLRKRAKTERWRTSSTRSAYNGAKAVLVEMFAQGLIPGDASRFFQRGAVPWRDGDGDGRQTSLSDAEQERLAKAVKADLVGIHHGRLNLTQGSVQVLRLLVVAHRQGLNPTPLLEMRRDALSPGFLPGTIRIRTAKHRNKKIRGSVGRAAQTQTGEQSPESRARGHDEQELFFDLSEGAVLQQAIESTRELVGDAPPALKQRIWLYRSRGTGKLPRGSITALNVGTLTAAITGVIRRHGLLGDDGKPLRVNLSRLRKSRFDRAFRAANGDIAVTANLMGNTPRVAGTHYPSMNDARKAEAAGFMNDDYPALMRSGPDPRQAAEIRPMQVHPQKPAKGAAPIEMPKPTPVSGCQDTLHGEHAPHDGTNHCDRYVMCLFCSSFAVVGTVEGLWRLFSFQVFARAELDYLDETLGAERTADELLEDLRDRYRVAIPYINDFTQRQFARTKVAKARAKTAAGLHPFWQHQMTMSRRARSRAGMPGPSADKPQDDAGTGDRVGT